MTSVFDSLLWLRSKFPLIKLVGSYYLVTLVDCDPMQ